MGPRSGLGRYIPSNSGHEKLPFETVFENVWTSVDQGLIHDWSAQEYNRGCWDTRMRKPSKWQLGYPDQAFVPENAAFPDGQYAVKVSAISHGGVEKTIFLPKERIGNNESNTIGIHVENYYPHIQSVEITSNSDVFYSVQYITPDLARPNLSERECIEESHARTYGYPLEMHIVFSEPVTIGEIKLEALVGDNINWQSLLISPTLGSDLSGQSEYNLVTSFNPPDCYLGKIRLTVSAHDMSTYENELDKDPCTIPFPSTASVGLDDECYEPGKVVYEWNIAEYLHRTPYLTLADDNKENQERLYEVNLDEVLENPFGTSVKLAFNTLGPTGTDIQCKGYCEKYSGFWAGAQYFFTYEESYKNTWLVYPSIAGINGWSYFEFELPLLYGPNINSYPHSCIQQRPIVTYTDGGYCFMFWRDSHAEDDNDLYITCISAHSLEMRTIHAGNTVTGSYVNPSQNDQIELHVDGTTTYYTPYSPEFFPEENSSISPIPNQFEKNQMDAMIENSENGALLVTIANPIETGENVAICIEGIVSTTMAKIYVYDTMGRVLHERHEECSNGNETIQIEVQPFPSGVYFVCVEIGGISQVKSIVVL